MKIIKSRSKDSAVKGGSVLQREVINTPRPLKNAGKSDSAVKGGSVRQREVINAPRPVKNAGKSDAALEVEIRHQLARVYANLVTESQRNLSAEVRQRSLEATQAINKEMGAQAQRLEETTSTQSAGVVNQVIKTDARIRDLASALERIELLFTKRQTEALDQLRSVKRLTTLSLALLAVILYLLVQKM